MRVRPPSSTGPDTLFPYSRLFRAVDEPGAVARRDVHLDRRLEAALVPVAAGHDMGAVADVERVAGGVRAHPDDVAEQVAVVRVLVKVGAVLRVAEDLVSHEHVVAPLMATPSPLLSWLRSSDRSDGKDCVRRV